MQSISYQIKPIGKTVADTKISHVWKFILHNRPTEIALKVSKLSGKMEVNLNQNKVWKDSWDSSAPFFYRLSVYGEAFEIRQISNYYDLFYQNLAFDNFKLKASNSINSHPILNPINIQTVNQDPKFQNNLLASIMNENNRRQTNPDFAESPFPKYGSPNIGIPLQNSPSPYPNNGFPSPIFQNSFGNQVAPDNNNVFFNPLQQNFGYNQPNYGFYNQPGIPTQNPYENKPQISLNNFCTLEKSADYFFEIDFRDTREANQMIYRTVHSNL